MVVARPSGPSLSAVLAQLGYTHEPGKHGARSIRRAGVEVVSGPWYAIWAWLIDTSQVEFRGRPVRSIVDALADLRSAEAVR